MPFLFLIRDMSRWEETDYKWNILSHETKVKECEAVGIIEILALCGIKRFGTGVSFYR